jgi:E3 ubiquitin-protein ligase RNF11
VLFWFEAKISVLKDGFLISLQESLPVYHPSPNVSRPVNQLTEEEQIKIAKRLGLIQHLPTGIYDGAKKKTKE